MNALTRETIVQHGKRILWHLKPKMLGALEPHVAAASQSG